MKHLFKFLLIFPWFYFFSWIEKANRDSKFFPIFYYFYWFYIPLYALFSLAWTVVSVLFFNIVLRNLTDIKLWGIWFHPGLAHLLWLQWLGAIHQNNDDLPWYDL